MRTCPKCGKSYDDTWSQCLGCKTALVLGADIPHEEAVIPVEGSSREDYAQAIEKMRQSIDKYRSDANKLNEAADKFEKDLVLLEEKRKNASPRRAGKTGKAKLAKPQGEGLEQFFGKSVFSTLGILLFVFSSALLVWAAFVMMSAAAKIGLGYGSSAALIVAGEFARRKNKAFDTYGKLMISGGWALIYYLTYAIHYSDAVRLINDPATAYTLLAAAAFGALLYTYRLKFEPATVFCYFLIYLTVNIIPPTVFTPLALFFIALSVMFFLIKESWVSLGVVGVVMTAYTQFRAAHPAHGAAAAAGNMFFFSFFCILAFWVVFELSTIWGREKKEVSVIGRFFSGQLIIQALNFILSLSLGAVLISAGHGEYANKALALGAILYLIPSVLHYRRKDGLCLPGSIMTYALIAALIFNKLDAIGTAAAFSFLGLLVFSLGLRFNVALWRGLGFVTTAISAAYLLVYEKFFVVKFFTFGSPVYSLLLAGSLFLFLAAEAFLYYRNRNVLSPTKAENKLFALAPYFYLFIYMTGTWMDFPKALTCIFWALPAVFLIDYGIGGKSVLMRRIGYILILGAATRLIMSGIAISGNVIGPLSYRMSICMPIVLLLHYSRMCLEGRSFAELNVSRKERKIPSVMAWMELVIIALLLRYEVPSYFVTTAWGLLAAAYAYAFIRTSYGQYIYMVTALIVLSGGRGAFVDLLPVRYLPGAELNAAVALGNVILLYALWFFFIRQRRNTMMEGKALNISRQGVAVASMGLTPIIFSMAFIAIKFDGFGLTLMWGSLAVLLFAAGLKFKAREARLYGLGIFMLSTIKAVFVDYAQGNVFYGMLAMGLILMGVSALYTKFSDKILKSL